MDRFAGKTFIVTGAGSGIGAATARRVLQEGAYVVLNGRREHKVQETLKGFPIERTLAHPGDVSKEEYVKRLVDATVRKFDKLDVLVNNAGMTAFAHLSRLRPGWRQTFATDLDSVFFTSREASPHLLQSKGLSSIYPPPLVLVATGV